MAKQHKILVKSKCHSSETMLTGTSVKLRSKIAKMLFGTEIGVLVLTPGEGINEITIIPTNTEE